MKSEENYFSHLLLPNPPSCSEGGSSTRTHSRYVICCCLIPIGIYGLKNNSRRITYGIGCVWGMPSLSPLSSLALNITSFFFKETYINIMQRNKHQQTIVRE